MTPMQAWLQNNKLFLQECAKGHRWELIVAGFLLLQGLQVELHEQVIRDDVSKRHEIEDRGDLTVEGILAEVKSRGVVFHTPADFPHDTAMVMTVADWNQKKLKAQIVICISQATGALMWIPTCTRERWEATKRVDSVRGITDTFYEAPKSLWSPIEALAPILREAQGSVENFECIVTAVLAARVKATPHEDPVVAELFA